MFILGSLKTRSGLPISVNWTFSLRATAEALWANIDWKSAISLQRSQPDPKLQVEGVAPTNKRLTTWSFVWYKNPDRSFFVLSQSTTGGAREGGARWCSRTGRPPAGAVLYGVNNLMVYKCTMWLSLKFLSPEALFQPKIHSFGGKAPPGPELKRCPDSLPVVGWRCGNKRRKKKRGREKTWKRSCAPTKLFCEHLARSSAQPPICVTNYSASNGR